MSRKILVVDDEKNIREGLIEFLQLDDYIGIEADNGKKAWEIINKETIDLVITDLKMPQMGGLELVKKIYCTYPTLPVIVLTGHGTIEDAVLAMHNGAVDFLTKPVNIKHLEAQIKRSFASKDLADKNKELKAELDLLKNTNGFAKMIGSSQKAKNLIETIKQVASAKATVLITGESGVGKELVANTIVKCSDRKDKKFIKVNCAALNSNLLESELFGHRRGSFTGAIEDREGRFEQANGGTIFLDEIGEIDMSTQVKLLRVLQEREFEKVGGNNTIRVDVRVIAATNKDLKKEVEKGNFREDLFFRLNVIEIKVPPLRERKEDILLLATEFLHSKAKENNKSIEGFSNEAISAISNYDWPGNIRELQNCIERAVVMCKKNIIELVDLSDNIRNAKKADVIEIKLGTTMQEAEKQLILGTLNYLDGNKSKAANMLDIGRKTIIRKLQEYEESERSTDI